MSDPAFRGTAIDGPAIDRVLEAECPQIIIPIRRAGQDFGQLVYYWRSPGFWSIIPTKLQ